MRSTNDEQKIVEAAREILSVFEAAGREAALSLWEELDRMTTGRRETYSAEVLDLVLQLEFFMEEHPESDLSDLRHALYVAKARKRR